MLKMSKKQIKPSIASMCRQITKVYLSTIKEYYETNQFVNCEMQKLVTTYEIKGRKIDFYLTFSKKRGADFGHQIGGLFYPKQQKNRRYSIEITLKINKDFNPRCYSDVNIRIHSCLVHEVEHYLQKIKFPYREKLPRCNYKTTEDYINSLSEIEAYTKMLYFIHKKTKVSFCKLLAEEAENISDDEDLQTLFMDNITQFIMKRKDLNLLKNIQF
jgi:hypothetical protein